MSNKQLNELYGGNLPNMPADTTVNTSPEPITLQPGEVDQEGAMAKADLYKLAKYSSKLYKKLEDNDQLEGWVQAKITKAADYVASVYHYLEYEMNFSKYGHKLDNAEMMDESTKTALRNKLSEARFIMSELKKIQAEKLEEGKSPKAKKDYDGDGKIESGKDEYFGSRRKAAGLDEFYSYGDKKDRQKAANKPKDELNIRSKDGVAKHGDEFKSLKKSGKLGISGPKDKLPEELDEFYSYGDKKGSSKPQDVLGRRPEGGIAKHGDEYKAMKKNKGGVKSDNYPIGGPKGKLPEDTNEMFYYGDKKDRQKATNKPKDELNIRSKDGVAKHGDEFKSLKKSGKLGISGPKDKLPEDTNESIKKSVKKAKKDYDGDGKIESGKDEYFGSKDKAIKKAMGKHAAKNIKREDQQLDELSKDTLTSYTDKAVVSGLKAHRSGDKETADKREKGLDTAQRKIYKKSDHGIPKSLLNAVKKNQNEDVTSVNESVELNAIKSLTKRLLG